MSVARDLKLCRVAQKHGAKYTLRTLRECRRNKIAYSWGLAMIEQESEWANVFGCDHGASPDQPPYCHQLVTNAKVRRLLDSEYSNGVGVTQLTSKNYVRDAHRKLGGAARIRNQIIVGMRVLKEKTGGDMTQAWKYNGDPSYQHEIQPKAERWHRRFRAAGLA